MIDHSLYVFAFLFFAIFLMVSLFIHTDFKFYVFDFIERLMEKLEIDIQEIEEEEKDLEKEIQELKDELNKK